MKNNCQLAFEKNFTKEKGWDLLIYDYLDGSGVRYADNDTYATWLGFKSGWDCAKEENKQ